MPIKLTLGEFNEQFQEADEESLRWDASDTLDTTYKFDAKVSQGWRREIHLRDGMKLLIDQHRLTDDLTLHVREYERSLVDMTFILSGKGQRSYTTAHSKSLTYNAREYSLHGSGLFPSRTDEDSNLEPFHILAIEACPSTICSFLSSPEQELPEHLQHLIKTPNEKSYTRAAAMQPVMDTVLQQILCCPYHGMVKRAYLESKTIELIALVLNHETLIQQGEVTKSSLKPEQLERIHYAKEILLRDLSNPPTLEELSRQVGLNDFLLKQGFRQVFDNTVFGELQTHRLEMAKEVLAEQDLSVSEAAHLAGYASARSFARAFRRRFRVGPKEYQKTCR